MAKSSSTLNLSQEVSKIEERLPSLEYTLCKGLKQPFNNTNSGSRKIMQGIQMEQTVQLLQAEVPIVSTGYENQFGEYSSNFIKADTDYRVLAKIPKFVNDPNRHYWLLLFAPERNELTCIERVEYKHITEFYGYLFNNEYIDSLSVNDLIHKDDIIKKTISYDKYNNRAEGINLATMYVACEDVKEDPIVVSESAAKRFVTPLIDKVEIKINDNDILLNLYGNETTQYKTFPDIGEEIKNSIFCAVRRELKEEEALFSQSWERLKNIMMNDKKYIVEGTVIDIDVYCNNPEKLEGSMYNNQIKKYYDQTLIFAQNLVDAVNYIIHNEDGSLKDINISYDLQKMYSNCNKVLAGIQYISDKVFNNIVINVYIQQNKPLHPGDKITDRYGGKGVISRIRPDNLMPHYWKNGKWVPIDIMYSMCTCINRLNAGQLFETSITYIGWKLLEYIRAGIDQQKLNYDQAFKLIYDYIYMLNPEQATFLLEQFSFTYDHTQADFEDNEFNRNMYIENMLHEGYILVSLAPISTMMDIDKLKAIYDHFPFIPKHCVVSAPIKDSNDNWRMVPTRRQLVIGYKYIYRLKQLAEEKFSVVSLASTNIRNENSKSRISKMHNAKFASTPVRIFGEMESSTMMAHLGVERFYEQFVLYSSSPAARRSHSKLLTGDPFEFNVRLDPEAVSQSADINSAYLKTLGVQLRFIKLAKNPKRFISKVVATLLPVQKKSVVYMIPDEIRAQGKEKAMEYIEQRKKEEAESAKRKKKDVVEFIPGVEEERQRDREYALKLKRLGLK